MLIENDESLDCSTSSQMLYASYTIGWGFWIETLVTTFSLICCRWVSCSKLAVCSSSSSSSSCMYYSRCFFFILPSEFQVMISGSGWGCLPYLAGVKISDLVPFTVSQTLVDHQRPRWYLLGCFSLHKIPEISITRTILMIWLEPLEHIDKGVLIFGIFQFFVFKLVLFRGRHQLLPHPHG